MCQPACIMCQPGCIMCQPACIMCQPGWLYMGWYSCHKRSVIKAVHYNQFKEVRAIFILIVSKLPTFNFGPEVLFQDSVWLPNWLCLISYVDSHADHCTECVVHIPGIYLGLLHRQVSDEIENLFDVIFSCYSELRKIFLRRCNGNRSVPVNFCISYATIKMNMVSGKCWSQHTIHRQT